MDTVIEGIASAFHILPWLPDKTRDTDENTVLTQNLALA